MLLIFLSIFPIFSGSMDCPIAPVSSRLSIETADCNANASVHHSAYVLPMPLRQLVVESDLILEGVAGESSEWKDQAGYSRGGFEVGEVLQGSWEQPAFSCRYYSQWTSCGQMEIKPGSRYLIFMELLDDGSYQIHGLESGAELVNDESLRSFRNAIGNLQLILHIKDKQQRNQAILEWLVCITVDPVALENVERIDDGTEQLYALFARQWSPRKLSYLLTAILSWNSVYQPRPEYLLEALAHCKNEEAQALFDRYWPVVGTTREFKGRPTLELAVANKIGRILKAEFKQKTAK